MRVGDGEATIDVGPAVGDARLRVETHNGDVTVGAADAATPR